MNLEKELYKQFEEKINNDISNLIDKLIKEKVKEFEGLLSYKKSEYVNEILKNIVLNMEQTPTGLNFKIIIKDNRGVDDK